MLPDHQAARSSQEPVETPEQSREVLGEQTAVSATERLQAELEASLAAGFVPNVWDTTSPGRCTVRPASGSPVPGSFSAS